MKKAEREINVYDLFVNWLIHWRSLAAFLTIGLLVAIILMVSRNDAESVNTINDLEMTAEDKKDVEIVASLLDEFVTASDIFIKNSDSLSVNERAEILYNLTYAQYLLDIKTRAFSNNQKVYLSTRGLPDETVLDTVDHTFASPVYSICKILLLAVFIHAMFFSIDYLFNDRIKHHENLCERFQLCEYTPMVDWDAINSKKGLDRIFCNMRHLRESRTTLQDAIEINVLATIEKLQTVGANSVAIIGDVAEKKMLAEGIIQKNENLTVKLIDSIRRSINGADQIIGVDAAIMVVKASQTRLSLFMEELKALESRNVMILGIVTVETQ